MNAPVGSRRRMRIQYTVHTADADADATRQLHRIGVDGVYGIKLQTATAIGLPIYQGEEEREREVYRMTENS